MDLSEMIQVARGEVAADVLLKNAKIVNVFSGEIHEGHVAIAHSRIVGMGDYQAKQEINLAGHYLCPGFIDAHVHIESSMVSVPQFTRAVLPRGTTSVVADPHEIANVLGLDGIRYMLESSKYNPLSVYFTLSSCVPATEMETSGSRLRAFDIFPYFTEKWVVGLAEMMNYPGVLFRDLDVLDKLKVAQRHGKRVDGHAPGLTGRDLAAYIAAGVSSDHECTTLEEAREKLRMGMYIMIREASGAHNLLDLLPLVAPANSRHCMFVTDDRHPADLMDEGHMDHLIRMAIHAGLDPVSAIQMATINPAEYYALSDKGAIVPGRRADLVVFDNFEEFHIEKVFRGGQLVAEGGDILPTVAPSRHVPVRSSVNITWDGVNLEVPADGSRLRVIEIVPHQIITRQRVEEATVNDGLVVSDVERDLLKIAVIERHLASGRCAVGFVRGFGLKRGALASSVAHDSHNIIVVGTNDRDMLTAVREIEVMRGGLVAVDHGQVKTRLPLPIAGLMSDQPIEVVRNQMDGLLAAAQDMGSSCPDPFMTLSFLALPVIPELKLTDQGLVDVNQFQFVPLFAE
ncbi:MAG: adenine deaminase [Chloroflexota bacterium]|nr:adenine deaminase [Chloroflexota bacterium]